LLCRSLFHCCNVPAGAYSRGMSESSLKRSQEFLKISDQFKLGVLTTESSHPATRDLSDVAKGDISAGLRELFEVDVDVVRKYREFVESGRATRVAAELVARLREGGKVFFTGCGSTGRLSIQLVSIWRDFWQRIARGGTTTENQRSAAAEMEHRAFSVMAGGDYALIKSVEGFEDFTAFGRKQIAELGVSAIDMVFAITEGGETSFVIGTAWQGVEVGAKVYFVYNNPDDVLCQHVERSRQVIEEPRVEKINLTTGPMGITGSTRMQATSIQLAVMLTVLEIAVGELNGEAARRAQGEQEKARPAESRRTVPQEFLRALETMHGTLATEGLRKQMAALVALEEKTYRSGHKLNYFADRFGIDVLTDTTERSPTYCTPPFRKFDDTSATESWAFLFVGSQETPAAWNRIIKREPRCVEWSESEVMELVGPEKAQRTNDIVRKISRRELMRFKVGLDGLEYRKLGKGDVGVAIMSEHEAEGLQAPGGFFRSQLEAARQAGATIAVVFVGRAAAQAEMRKFIAEWAPQCLLVGLEAPETDFLLDGVTRVGLKMGLNSLSTCTMVRLGRVMGNYMIWVVPSNLKLIDRATRYIQRLTTLDYKAANELLFEIVEYVEPRMKADQAYPPVVGVAVLRAREGLSNHEAEERLLRM
jgi:N-acetylmuramic acid 6-phosphate etherase